MISESVFFLVLFACVTVIVQAEGDDYFRGLFLQARMTGCNVNETKTIGVFTNTDRELVTRHCFGEVHVCIFRLIGRFFCKGLHYWLVLW